jgi:hypothetical protein
MARFTMSFVTRSSPHSTTSGGKHENSKNQTATFVFTCGVFAIVLIGIIIISFCAFYKCFKNRRLKNRRQIIHPRDISSIRVAPAHNNIVPDVIEDPPPSYYSVMELQERQYEPITRF